jgi:HEAT repeat protein
MLRGAGAAVLVLAGAGVWASFNATELRVTFAAQRLSTAATDEDRARWADALTGYGEPGVRRLVGYVKTGDEQLCAAATAALEKYLTNLPDGDPRGGAAAGAVLDAFPGATAVGKRAVLHLVPLVLKRTGPTHAMRCRGTVVEGLKASDFETRLAAVRLTIHPDIRLRAAVVPLLTAPEAELRAAALFAIASTAEGETVIGDEDLFRWLHDPDAGVRKVCRDALVARDRSDAEIALGRRLTSAEPNERLKLLLDLRYDDDVADPEPWLERLSRDPEPAVRAGAARVAVELAAAHRHPCPTWVARVADADPHPTVRFIAAYYRAQPTGAPRDQVRPVNGQ